EKVQQADAAAAEILYLCALLDADSISEEIITKGASKLGPVLQSVATDPIKLNEAIAVLLSYSLIRRNPDHTLTIHRLVKAFLKHSMTKRIQLLWAKRAIHALKLAFPEVDYATWQQCQQYLPHIQACVVLIHQLELALPEAIYLLRSAGGYLRESARYEQ